MSLRLLTEAEAEAQEAARWYDAQWVGLGDDFLAVLAELLESIEQFPRRHAAVPIIPPGREIRRMLTKRFPDAVVNEVRDTDIIVLAMGDTRRRPAYWLSRNGGTP